MIFQQISIHDYATFYQNLYFSQIIIQKGGLTSFNNFSSKLKYVRSLHCEWDIMESQASSVESVYDSEEGNIYEEVHEDIPDDVTVYEDVDSDDSDQAEMEKSFRDMKSIIEASYLLLIPMFLL